MVDLVKLSFYSIPGVLKHRDLFLGPFDQIDLFLFAYERVGLGRVGADQHEDDKPNDAKYA